MVQIKIDTKKDSKEDIRQVIQFLEKMISGESYPSQKEGSEIEVGAFNMFGSDNDDNDDEISPVEEPIRKPDIKFKPELY